MPTKLSIVRQALATNPNVVVVDSREIVRIPNTGNLGYAHSVDFLVVPRVGIYTPDEMQRFLDGLVPNLPPDGREDSRHHALFWVLGELTFKEQIGTEQLKVSLEKEVEDEFKAAGRSITMRRTAPLSRTISVCPSPSEDFARSLLLNRAYDRSIELYALTQYLIARKLFNCVKAT